MTQASWKLSAIITIAVAVTLGGCVVSQPDPEPPAVDHEALTADAAEALTVVSELAVVFQDVANGTEESDASAPGASDEEAEAIGPQVETAAADSLTGPAGERCVTSNWEITNPLWLEVSFDECELPNGELLDGSASIWLERAGRSGVVGVAFEELIVGQAHLDGFIVVSASGEGLLQLDVDVAYSDAERDLQLVLTDASLAISEGSATLDGAGEFTSDGVTYAAEATDLIWDNPDNCYPTSGTLRLELPDTPVITATFFEDALGAFAMVRVGPLPAYEMRLTCPGV